MPGYILTAVDPNHPDPRIVEAAAVLARTSGAGLTLMAVVSPPPLEPMVAIGLDEAALGAARAELEDVSLAAGDVRVEIRTVQSAGPAGAIQDIARRGAFQAIVAGTGRHRRFGRIGSVASRLLHGSPCPVMVVPPRLFDAGRSFERIGVAYVPTEDGLDALHAAESFARSVGAPLQVISITADEGDPATLLADASHELDLLVCGTRGHGPVTGLVLGTVSQRLVHEASCPVLVVPHGQQRAVKALVKREAAVV
jgi:nucleotide-binding universal stress UspA family protein